MSDNKVLNDFSYAIDEADALARADKWYKIDPFPLIDPALLNSADIADYIYETAMIWPFYGKDIKASACELHLGNEFLYWDSEGNKIHKKDVSDNDPVRLSRNSITYVTLKESFLVPTYIALRFNLTINHVHRGLLLGTGPLVNPCFQGKLMIPIHNLTPNEYLVSPGDPLISVEITKLSRIQNLQKTEPSYLPERRGSYVEKPKVSGSMLETFSRAMPHDIEEVKSSLSQALDASKIEIQSISQKSKEEIDYIKSEVDKEISSANKARWVVSGASLLSVAALVFMVFQIFLSNQQFISKIYKDGEYHKVLLEQQNRHLNQVQNKLNEIEKSNLEHGIVDSRVELMQDELDSIKRNIDTLYFYIDKDDETE